MSCASECADRDLTGKGVALLVWCLPAALVLAGAVWPVARFFLWTPSLAVMGVACLANASRCGRLHCFLTGPIFLIGAVLSGLTALDVLELDWRWLLGSLIGLVALAYGLELVRGKYVRTSPIAPSPRP